MALQLRVQLSSGKTHRIPLADSDPEQVIRKLRGGLPPFDEQWLEDSEWEFVNMHAVVSVYVEPADGHEPLIAHG